MRTKILPVISIGIACTLSVLAMDGGNNHNNNNNNNNNNGNSSFQASVIGSAPGLAIGGVASGGVPWVLNQGDASISSDGRIQLQVQGLLIAAGGLAGTTGPVTMVGATLVCGGTGGTPVPASGAVTPSPLSSSGDAQINQTVSLPATCFAPALLVRIFTSSAPLGSQLGAFIAVTGMTSNGNQNQNQDNDNDENHRGRGHGL